VTKQVFEFQLHTESSFAAKQVEHGYYDWRRLPGVKDDRPAEYAYAKAQSDAIFGAVRFPDGAIRIGFRDGKAVLLDE
jgi:hypothetical protein